MAPLIAPYDPVVVDFGAMLTPPIPMHWLGTDAFGRDVSPGSSTARGRPSSWIRVGVRRRDPRRDPRRRQGATLGGRVDLYLQRVIDVFISFPLIILALAMVAILGNNLPNLITAITIPMSPRCALVIRSSALAICEQPYVNGGPGRRLPPPAHHPATHAAQRHGAVPDHADRVPRPG